MSIRPPSMDAHLSHEGSHESEILSHSGTAPKQSLAASLRRGSGKFVRSVRSKLALKRAPSRECEPAHLATADIFAMDPASCSASPDVDGGQDGSASRRTARIGFFRKEGLTLRKKRPPFAIHDGACDPAASAPEYGSGEYESSTSPEGRDTSEAPPTLETLSSILPDLEDGQSPWRLVSEQTISDIGKGYSHDATESLSSVLNPTPAGTASLGIVAEPSCPFKSHDDEVALSVVTHLPTLGQPESDSTKRKPLADVEPPAQTPTRSAECPPEPAALDMRNGEKTQEASGHSPDHTEILWDYMTCADDTNSAAMAGEASRPAGASANHEGEDGERKMSSSFTFVAGYGPASPSSALYGPVYEVLFTRLHKIVNSAGDGKIGKESSGASYHILAEDTMAELVKLKELLNAMTGEKPTDSDTPETAFPSPSSSSSWQGPERRFLKEPGATAEAGDNSTGGTDSLFAVSSNGIAPQSTRPGPEAADGHHDEAAGETAATTTIPAADGTYEVIRRSDTVLQHRLQQRAVARARRERERTKGRPSRYEVNQAFGDFEAAARVMASDEPTEAHPRHPRDRFQRAWDVPAEAVEEEENHDDPVFDGGGERSSTPPLDPIARAIRDYSVWMN